ncbi:MAG TPA: FUN14 domain-containing protein [Candidatus Ozemobacteraceae bacterium]|nr:FUN14 domain-containing protein [Candidatus Ozemobacteraceae bacterium]
MTESRLSRFVRRAASPLMVCFLLAAAGEASAVGSATAATASSTNPLAQLPPEVNFFVTTLGFGGIAGWCVGYTLKKFAKMAALVVGMIFMSIQYLAYNNYVTVDWEKIRQTVPPSGMEQLWAGLMSVFTYNLPFAGAFAAGLLMGFRKG